MVWLTTLLHRLFVSACHLVHSGAGLRRTPPSECTPVSVLSVAEEGEEDDSLPSAPTTLSLSDPSPSPPASLDARARLFALPDDMLLEIVRRVTHARHDAPANGSTLVVDHRSYARSIALAQTSRQLEHYFYRSLDNVCLSSDAVDDQVVDRLARRTAAVLNRIVLRGCTNVSNHAVHSLAEHSQALRSVDLSFITSVTDDGIIALCASTAPRLRKLLLRKCERVGDASLKAVAQCAQLDTLDLSYCPRVTDVGLFKVAFGCGKSLRLLAVSHDVLLTDRALRFVGRHCKVLNQFCARGLPNISDVGLRDLCEGLRDVVEGIDVTDCISITRDSTLLSLRTYCKKIYTHIIPSFASKSLRHILVSTLRQNIFIVHGSDPNSGRETVHTVLIDNGDIVSASLLSSGTTDLSMLGIVLCKSYGKVLDEGTKKMLEDDYGIPTSSLAD